MKRIFLALCILSTSSFLCAAQSYDEKCISGDCNNGYGSYQYSNGDTYTGEFWDSKKNGHGIYKWLELKDEYRGEFHDDVLEGQGVYYFSSTKKKYVGEFKDGVRNGEGMMLDKSGNVTDNGLYENDAYVGKISYYGNASDATGCLHGDCENGYSLYRYAEGDRYLGNYVNGYRDGYGTYYYSNGNKYVGEWTEGVINGYGVFYWADGTKYIGEFNQVARDGYGIYYYTDGSKNIGLWKDNEFSKSKEDFLKENNYNPCIEGDCNEGYGEYLSDYGIYLGYWKDGYMDGAGIYIFDAGDFYTGEWADNKRNGYGTYYFTEGGMYKGEFQDQSMHGSGIRYYNDGLIEEGYWESGYYIGSSPSDGSVDYTDYTDYTDYSDGYDTYETDNYEVSGPDSSYFSSTTDESYTKRLALVIGNSNYPDDSYLPNPVNDAREMTSALQTAGFEVITVYNGSNKDITDAIKQFGERLNSFTVGLFYYSGHGVQVDGVNYVVPIDAAITDPTDVRYECVDAGRVLAKMEYAGTKVNIMILDACRTNPFLTEARGGDTEGLAPMDAPAGTFIAYATSPNKTASDGAGSNGLYTAELLKFVNFPNLKIEDMFKQVRIKVLEQSSGDQLPWETSSLVGDFYFIKQ